MAHRKAKLMALGRELLVDRILVDGMAAAHDPANVGVTAEVRTSAPTVERAA